MEREGPEGARTAHAARLRRVAQAGGGLFARGAPRRGACGVGDSAGALLEFERARVLYEPIVAGDPGNAWAQGALADSYLAMGKAKERIARAGAVGAPGLDRLDAACRLYARANGIFEKMQTAGKLASMRAKSSAEAASDAAGAARTPRDPRARAAKHAPSV